MNIYLSPDQVTEMIPGITKGQLAQWRYQGVGGPRYRKLGKKIIYVQSEVVDWIEDSARTGTALEAV
ncbi:helix-turn-helix domain-containing protein [Cryobacterium sp. 1639]|uniref:helix-turn-helix domain-containing protein n=1 Tax=Cryobacterium inferilacus TaxID=2866629 RepID=UPI001C733958|nr:helix-turn-helix domain-containing protein [Cryobacterium sp. 1639]MBX0299402.1 helix-turn-helix domain-containing protein [Cryobacterium sp. 1639]